MAEKETSTLTLSGEGRVSVKPDVARIQLSVITEGKTAASALAENSARATRVFERLRSNGLGEKDLQTAGLSVTPIVDYDEKSPDKGRIVGYRAENTIAVEAPVDLAGRVIDEAIDAGSNQMTGLSFEVRDERPYRAEALDAAVRAAKADAATVAGAMGVRIAGVRTVDVEDTGRPVFYKSMAREALAAPIAPGEVAVSARVRVVFELAPGGAKTAA